MLASMDPENPIVRLCVAGMQCESDGRTSEASRLFQQAWAESADDFERCIAAHYVARHQQDPSEALQWNQRSLDCAAATGDPRVAEFYPSLYLNLGKAHEDLRDQDQAEHFYKLAQQSMGTLPDGRYGGIVHEAVERALRRIRPASGER